MRPDIETASTQTNPVGLTEGGASHTRASSQQVNYLTRTH